MLPHITFLSLDLRISARSFNYPVDLHVCVFVHDAPASFGISLAPWRDLHTCGVSQLVVRLVRVAPMRPLCFVELFLGLSWPILFVAVLIRALHAFSRCFQYSHLEARLDDARRHPSRPQCLPTVSLDPSLCRHHLGGCVMHFVRSHCHLIYLETEEFSGWHICPLLLPSYIPGSLSPAWPVVAGPYRSPSSSALGWVGVVVMVLSSDVST